MAEDTASDLEDKATPTIQNEIEKKTRLNFASMSSGTSVA